MKAAFAALLLVAGLPAAAAMFCLLTPTPIPDEQLPSPNGWDDLVAAGKMLEKPSNWQSYPGSEPKLTQKTLQKQVVDDRAAVARGRLGMQQEVVARVDYLDGDLDSLAELQALRNLGRAIIAEGGLAEMQGKPVDAAGSYVDCIEFGIRSTRGGMMIDGIMGFANALGGAELLYELQANLDAHACRASARRILESLDELEPKELLHHRDRIWSQHARGWHGRLLLGLTDFTGDYYMDMSPDGYLYTHDRNVAALRMLALELLARAMFLEGGAWPMSVEEIRAWAGVPREQLIDPLDRQGRLLLINALDDGVMFYSVGENGVDDGGIAPNVENEEQGVMEGGDLRLAEVFKPLEWETDAAAIEVGGENTSAE